MVQSVKETETLQCKSMCKNILKSGYKGLLNWKAVLWWGLLDFKVKMRLRNVRYDVLLCSNRQIRYLWQRTLFGQSALIHFLEQLFESVPDSRMAPLFTGQILQLWKTTAGQNHKHDSVTSSGNKVTHQRSNHKTLFHIWDVLARDYTVFIKQLHK